MARTAEVPRSRPVKASYGPCAHKGGVEERGTPVDAHCTIWAAPNMSEEALMRRVAVTLIELGMFSGEIRGSAFYGPNGNVLLTGVEPHERDLFVRFADKPS